MQNSLTENQFIEKCVGYSRYDCIEALSTQGIESISFGHWLAIPSKQLLLVFRHQQCVALECYQIAA